MLGGYHHGIGADRHRRARVPFTGAEMGRPPKLTRRTQQREAIVPAVGNRLLTLAAAKMSAARGAPTPTQDAAPVRPGGTTFVRCVLATSDRLQLPDAEALELIAHAGKIGPSGKRPRDPLGYLPEIEAAL
jgi:hypothetical protein